jgi:hypothetical protein
VATNLSDIGFSNQGSESLVELAQQCHKRGKAVRCSQGKYLVWAPGGGVELYAQLDRKDELIGLNPHFAGRTRLSAGLVQRVTRAALPMDGGFRAWAQPHGGEEISGEFEFVFDVPDFWAHEKLAAPAIRSVQLCAFVQQCVLFQNEADGRARLARAAPRLAARGFIALGLESGEGQGGGEPLPSAILCGPVLDAVELTNPVSREQFWWLRVKTAAGEVDAVAERQMLPVRTLPGMFLQCTAWLSGKLVR